MEQKRGLRSICGVIIAICIVLSNYSCLNIGNDLCAAGNGETITLSIDPNGGRINGNEGKQDVSVNANKQIKGSNYGWKVDINTIGLSHPGGYAFSRFEGRMPGGVKVEFSAGDIIPFDAEVTAIWEQEIIDEEMDEDFVESEAPAPVASSSVVESTEEKKSGLKKTGKRVKIEVEREVRVEAKDEETDLKAPDSKKVKEEVRAEAKDEEMREIEQEAKDEPPTFTVTFNLNGGTFADKSYLEPKTFQANYNDGGTWWYDMSAGWYPLDVSMRGPNGERFVGWYDANGVEYMIPMFWISGDIELFARYEEGSQLEFLDLSGGRILAFNERDKVFTISPESSYKFYKGKHKAIQETHGQDMITGVSSGDFGPGLLRLGVNGDGGVDLQLEHDGKRYKYLYRIRHPECTVNKIMCFVKEKKEYVYCLNLSNLTFNVYFKSDDDIWADEFIKEAPTEEESFILDGIEFRLLRREVVQLPSGVKIEVDHVANIFREVDDSGKNTFKFKLKDLNAGIRFDYDAKTNEGVYLRYINPNNGEKYTYVGDICCVINAGNEYKILLGRNKALFVSSVKTNKIKIGGITFTRYNG